jgi:hypothetical protein
MNYLKVRWKHSDPNYPILIFSELDEERWEIRKVEVYEDGRIESASGTHETEGTKLSLEPLPTLEEIVADPVFEATLIGKDDFEQMWSRSFPG